MKNKLKLFGLAALIAGQSLAFGGNKKGNPKSENPNEQTEIAYKAQPISIQNIEEGINRNIEISKQGIKVFEHQSKSDKEIYLETPNGKLINISMNPKGDDQNCTISNDGGKIYFSSERKNAKGKMQKDIFEANIENLVANNYQIVLKNISQTKENSDNPSISKDGSKLVYENNSQIILADLKKGTKEQLTTIGENYQPNIINEKIVYASIKLKDKKSGISIIDLKDSLRTPKLVVKSSEYDFSSPKFNSDETKIAYIKDFSKVYVRDLELKKTKGISSTYGTVSAPSWSSDNRFVSYLGTKRDSKENDKIEIYVVDVKDLNEIKKEKIHLDKHPSKILMNKGFGLFDGSLSTISSDGSVVYSGTESPIKEYQNTLISSDTASK